MFKYQIFTSEDCPVCKQVKKWFIENNIAFEEKVLGKDFNRGDFIAETSKRGKLTMAFPAIIKNNECYTTKEFILRSVTLNYAWLEENILGK